jgi:chemotaxis protein MotB
MAKKQKKQAAGAPAWVLTYGDMMSLLLCFFIMLAAMARYDEPNPRVEAALDSIRRALGMTGQTGKLPDRHWDFQSLLRRLETVVKTARLRHQGQADVKGVEGKQLSIRQVRDGAEITVGGPVAFTRFSASIQPEAQQLIKNLALELRGHLNKIEVRGHATTEPLPPNAKCKTPMELSIARALAVRAALIDGGVNPRTIRVVGVGANEPILNQAYSEERLAANRRVEVLVRQSVISEFDGEPITAETADTPAPPEAKTPDQ